MDDKAKCILDHYKSLIEENRFDEYDIWGFLIFIRNYLDNHKYPGIAEFCNLIAHRQRDRGIVMKCIEKAIKNNYETLPNSKAVRGYQGITKEQWEKEWKRFSIQYNIAICGQTLSEIMLCLFSLAQFTEYSSSHGTGKIILMQGRDGTISLATSEGKPSSLYVCFSRFAPYSFFYEYPAGIISDVVETKRIDNELRLYANDIRII